MPDIISIGEPLFELNQAKGESVFRPGHGGELAWQRIGPMGDAAGTEADDQIARSSDVADQRR